MKKGGESIYIGAGDFILHKESLKERIEAIGNVGRSK